MNPILTESSFNVPAIRQGLDYLQTQLVHVLEQSGEQALAKSFRADAPDEHPQLPKVYSLFFQLLNVAEEFAVTQHRIKLEETEGTARVSGLWGQTLTSWREEGISATQALERLQQTSIEPVFTAHPTESKRTTVLEQLNLLFEAFSDFQTASTATAKRDAERTTRVILYRLWLTGEVFLAKPSVADELRNIIHYLSGPLPAALEKLDQRLVEAWEQAGWQPDALANWRSWPRVTFGDWVGGDRDGHPFVTDVVTRDTLTQLRHTALQLVHGRLSQLAKRLSFSETMVPPAEDFRQRIAARAESLGEEGQQALERNPKEPWRQWVNLMLAQLPPVGHDTPTVASARYHHASELVDDLSVLLEALHSAGVGALGRSEIFPIIRQVQTFGFHLAHLDIRQNSRYHDLALTQLMQAAHIRNAETFAQWSETDRMQFLEEELRSPRPFTADLSRLGDEAKQVVNTLRVVNEYLREFGHAGVGSLIVSMTRQTSDLLVVYLLAREAGLVEITPQGWLCSVPVVPLFETIDDLHRSEGILDRFLDNTVTRRTLQAAGKRRGLLGLVQQVMIGYSDSNKDGGIFSSLWGLQQAQRNLAKVADRHGVSILFFHGRGGSVSRGAGPTHRFISSCPPSSLMPGFRQTEQGEVIAQKYARVPTAVYHLEAQLAGVARQRVMPDQPDPWFVETMNWISEQSRQAYERLISAPRFIDFFTEATPLDVIEHSGIGSRPARRTGQRTLADLRAIPWVFSWSQSRFYLPAWFGVGAALHELKHAKYDDFVKLRGCITRQPGLHYILTNVSSALMLADPAVMKKYAVLVRDESLRESFMEVILAEYQNAFELVNELIGSGLEQRRPGMFAMMAIRNEKLQVLHTLQVQQIQQWREHQRQQRTTEAQGMIPQLLQTVNAIASGLRATG
jgi:phosphoenolpyruvate carboxylase